jgi:hypothetical protein
MSKRFGIKIRTKNAGHPHGGHKARPVVRKARFGQRS